MFSYTEQTCQEAREKHSKYYGGNFWPAGLKGLPLPLLGKLPIVDLETWYFINQSSWKTAASPQINAPLPSFPFGDYIVSSLAPRQTDGHLRADHFYQVLTGVAAGMEGVFFMVRNQKIIKLNPGGSEEGDLQVVAKLAQRKRQGIRDSIPCLEEFC